MRSVSANGDIFAACRISSEYALPTPAITVWSVSTPLIWPLRLRIAVGELVGGDGEDVRAEPGDAGDRAAGR